MEWLLHLEDNFAHSVMRLYIRNKVKYDPLNSGKALLFVDFADPRGFSVGQVKEVCLRIM